jgi:ribonuclease Z
MLNYVQILTTPTADTLGTAILLHFDNQRYVFGNIPEGTQRALVQRKIALGKVENLFMSGLVDWRSTGGLLGLILTIADVLAGSKAQSALNNAAKTNKSKQGMTAAAASKLTIHAGKNLCHLLATSRRFIFRKGLPLRPHEVRSDPRTTEPASSEPDWKDENINVWYMPVEPNQKDLASPRKRSHDEFREGNATRPCTSRDDNSQKLVQMVVTQMFDSDWTADALVETTLHQAKLPAKLFVRDDKGHLQVYSGPMPGGEEHVPDIPVLVRQPWPSATVTELPRTEPSKQSLCYIVKGHDRRGKFNPQAAERLGVAKKDYRFLTNLQSVKGKDGNVVTPEMVLSETVAGSGFAVVDLPDISYIDPLVNRTEWADSQIMKGIHVIFWILGSDIVNDARLQNFMEKLSSVKHIVTSTDTCPNMIALESAATQSYKLRCIDSDRFPLPAHSNVLSLSGSATTGSSTYESGRTGKTIQFSPSYLHQDDKIVPFPDIEKFARADLDSEVLEMAARARSKISDPAFIARVEKVEADIPNRDAEIISLGTGSALPSKYRNVSATLVRVPGYGNYLFDAGENTMGQMRRVFGHELPSVLRDLKAIWISHLHADHHLGTVAVIKAWHEETSKSDPSAKLLVASHSHMIDWLREYADIESYGFERLVPIPFSRYDARSRVCESRVFSSEETKRFGLEKIEGCWVNHCFGALATAFTFPSGLKIAYSGDCRPSDAFVQIGQGATILIHESTFDDDLQGDAIAKKHSTMSEAIDVGRRMGARRILLTHFSQRYQKVPSMEEDLEVQSHAETGEEARTDEVILVAFDYMRVKLGEFRKAQAFLPAIQKLLEGVEQ